MKDMLATVTNTKAGILVSTAGNALVPIGRKKLI